MLGILAPLPAIGALLATQPKYGIPMLAVTLLAILGGALRLWFLQLVGLGGMALASIGWVAFAFQLYDFSASRGSSMILGSGLDQIFGHITLALGISMGVGAFLLRHREWLVATKTPAE